MELLTDCADWSALHDACHRQRVHRCRSRSSSRSRSAMGKSKAKASKKPSVQFMESGSVRIAGLSGVQGGAAMASRLGNRAGQQQKKAAVTTSAALKPKVDWTKKKKKNGQGKGSKGSKGGKGSKGKEE